jgi:KaiC/GvpD/RAD55 family RecA-like ATPase
MVKIGIPKLDSVLKDGFPENSNILVEGPPGVGKQTLADHFLYEGLKAGESIFYVSTKPNVAEIERHFKKYGMDLTEYLEKDRVVWFDAEGISEGPHIIKCNISELYTISFALKQLLQKWAGRKIRGVLHIVSPALMINDRAAVYRFLFDLDKTLHQQSVALMFIVEEGMHEKEAIVSLEQLCDVIVEMKTVEDGTTLSNVMRVKKMEGLPASAEWLRFWVGEKGIEMLK